MVSAIITTYKRKPDMVMRALTSILRQTYRDIEIIVVDDSPPDYCARKEVESSVLSKQKDLQNIKIKYIAHEKNMGACVARNTGLNAATGEYVAYLDDDDEWLPEKLEKQVNVIKQSDVALVYCGSLCMNDDTGKCKEKAREFVRGRVFDKLILSNFIESTSYPLIRTECLRMIGGFDPLMQSAQDYDVWLRLAEHYAIDYVDEPLVLYHEHSGERITTNPAKKINGLQRINEKFATYLEKDKLVWRKRNINIAVYFALVGDFKKAFSLWRESVHICPSNFKENIQYLLMIVRMGIMSSINNKMK